jgi:flagellar motor switch protein FliN
LLDEGIIKQVIAACETGLADASQAFQRILEEEVTFAAPAVAEFDVVEPPEECRGDGLMLALRVDSQWMLLVLQQASGLLPEWCASPDSSSRERLMLLAQELGSVLLPVTLSIDDTRAGYVHDLMTALHRAGFTAQTSRVTIQVTSGDRTGILSLLWPATHADAALNALVATTVDRPVTSGELDDGPLPAAGSSPDDAAAGGAPKKRLIQYQELEDGLTQLPAYSRSLLKIKVPVMVTLAETKQPIENVLAIGPGSIIHFNKPCEDSLALEIDGQKVALGEAVKVGDKFGLWITSMILPEERFWVISNRPKVERAK